MSESPTWILEVQKYILESPENPEYIGQFEHVGYMNMFFLTKQEACNYYDLYNPKLRSLNAFGTWVSDWNPIDNLRYVIRKWNGECLKIEPF